MKSFLFPGQASQYVGMGSDLYNNFPIAQEYFDKADDILQLDLKNACFNGPDEKLVRTEYTQPAIFTHSVIIDVLLKKAGIKPDIAAGHSLGEYSALVSAGVFSFEEGLKAVGLRSRLMQKCCDDNPGTMAAIIGLTLDQVNEVIKDIDDVVPANFNSPAQTAISGVKKAVETACGRLKENGAKKTIMLAVGGAYHSPLMKHAKDEMTDFIETLKFNKFAFPVIANVSAQPVDDPATMKQLLCEQITSPVLWHPTIEKMYDMGVEDFYEIGPGKVLLGLLKRSSKGKQYTGIGVDSIKHLENITGVKVE
ncbi:MAG: ACP S-malonyltransferase [candidate division Zixibacteria bacterium]|nr:ACP S-malonyltransferase [candidate division Zixibacteria bacterium]